MAMVPMHVYLGIENAIQERIDRIDKLVQTEPTEVSSYRRQELIYRRDGLQEAKAIINARLQNYAYVKGVRQGLRRSIKERKATS